MGIGVLEARSPEPVPGTVHLKHVVDGAKVDAGLSNLKYTDGKNGKVLLTPQPSDDPNDPLNWSPRKKNLVALIVYMGSIVNSASTAPLLTAGTVQIAQSIHTSVSNMTTLSSGYYLLAGGVTSPFVAAYARKFGKRAIFVFSSILAVVGCVVGGVAQGYGSLLAARVIQGIAQTAYETLVFASIGDMMFLHERGPRVALGVFLLNAVVNLVGIVAGTITTNLGWRYNFYILLPFAALQAILTILFVPETSYRRKLTDEAELADTEGDSTSNTAGTAEFNVNTARPQHVAETPAQKSWLQELSLHSGSYVNDPLWKIFISFPIILVNLGVAFAVISCGLTLTWLATCLILASVLLAEPPYDFTSSEVGYASAAGAIGALLAGLFMGFCSDRCIKALTHRNRGIYEPEFQLPLNLPAAIFVISGFVGLAYTYQRGESVYIVCVCWGIVAFGLSSCNTTYYNYALSAFEEYSSETLIMSACFRNILGYGMTLFIVQWVEDEGPQEVFSIIAGISGLPVVLVVVFYVFGKRYRLFWHQHNLLKKWHLEMDKMDVIGG